MWAGVASLPAPSPVRHGGCEKDSNRRAACPLPQLSGRGIIFREASSNDNSWYSFGSGGFSKKHLVITVFRKAFLLSSANHSDSSGLARALALSFSRVAAARRIPVLPHVLPRNSGFLARARHARGNDRKIRPSGRACHYLVQDSIFQALPIGVFHSAISALRRFCKPPLTTRRPLMVVLSHKAM